MTAKIIRAMPNKVIVKFGRDNDFIESKAGKLWINPDYNPAEHVYVIGKVISIGTLEPFSLQWVPSTYPDAGIYPGDSVFVDYFAVLEAGGTSINPGSLSRRSTVVEHTEKTITLSIDYNDIFCVVSKLSEDFVTLVPLNGYSIVKPVDDPSLLKSDYIEIVGSKNPKKNPNQYWEVVVPGYPNIAYNEKMFPNKPVDPEITDIPTGATVLTTGHAGRPLGRILHRDLAKLDLPSDLHVVQGRWIVASFPNA